MASFGRCKLVRAVTLLAVPPMPSQGDFPWEVAKKSTLHQFQNHLNADTSMLYKCFLFLYWPAHPPLKYSIFLMWEELISDIL